MPDWLGAALNSLPGDLIGAYASSYDELKNYINPKKDEYVVVPLVGSRLSRKASRRYTGNTRRSRRTRRYSRRRGYLKRFRGRRSRWVRDTFPYTASATAGYTWPWKKYPNIVKARQRAERKVSKVRFHPWYNQGVWQYYYDVRGERNLTRGRNDLPKA